MAIGKFITVSANCVLVKTGYLEGGKFENYSFIKRIMRTICFFMLSLLCCIRYCSTQFAAVTRRQPKTHCENPNKNSLIENFFNIIFTEFYSTPPVCVCVQMCVGQSTYCYPNGCLKTATAVHEGSKDVPKIVETPPPQQLQKNKNQFMLVKDETYDFMSDFLKRNYVDESKLAAQKIINPLPELRPDPFKDKYSMVGKYKRVPKVEIRYNINEKSKAVKSDLAKIEGVDLTKTRWPLNRSNRASTHTFLIDAEKPLISHSNFFKTMLPDNEVAEYPPKYFKRDLTNTKDGDDVNIKAFYLLENSLDGIGNKTFSLETLIDTLIRSSFNNDLDIATTSESDTNSEQIIVTKTTTEIVDSANATTLLNETTSVISMNLTNENIDKNKYIDDNSKTNKTDNINEMITYLAKQIEIQNNTSMEIAKHVVGGLDENTLRSHHTENGPIESEFIHNEQITTNNGIIDATNMEIESIKLRTEPTTVRIDSTTLSADTPAEYSFVTRNIPEIRPTKKNRQRVIRKLNNSRFN